MTVPEEPRSLARPRALRPGDRLAVLCVSGPADPEPLAAGLDALRSAGLPVVSVEPACVQAKSSRPFVAVTDDGRGLFIKALGSDQRDADLLYRAYRFARLRNVGDTWPAASVIRAVEHQALVAVMAERAAASAFPLSTGWSRPAARPHCW